MSDVQPEFELTLPSTLSLSTASAHIDVLQTKIIILERKNNTVLSFSRHASRFDFAICIQVLEL